MIERRNQAFSPDEAKFLTQKTVTVFILLIFGCVCGWVFYQDQNPSERATVLQTVINLAILAVTYWLGSSKGAADNRDQLNKLIGPPGIAAMAANTEATMANTAANAAATKANAIPSNVAADIKSTAGSTAEIAANTEQKP